MATGANCRPLKATLDVETGTHLIGSTSFSDKDPALSVHEVPPLHRSSHWLAHRKSRYDATHEHRKVAMIVRLLIVALLSFPAVTAAQVSDPTNRGAVDGFELKSEPVVAWKYTSPKRKNFQQKQVPIGLSDVCIADGVIYVGDDLGVLRAFRSSDGAKLWEREHGERIYSSPVSDGARVYIGTEIGIEAIDCKDGNGVWKKDIRGTGGMALWPPRPAKQGKLQMLFVGSDDGKLNAFITRTGTKRWSESMMFEVPDDPEGFDGKRARIGETKARPRGIATDGKMIFQGIFDQSRVVAMSAAGGDTKWSFATKGWVGAAPTVDRDRVFIGSQDKKVYCVDRDTGKQIWEFPTRSRVSSAPAVRGNKVFASSSAGHMHCLDRDTGEELWSYRTDPDKTGRRFIYCKPIVTDDTVYFAVGCGLIYALNTDNGELRWKFRPLPDSQIYSAIVTDGKRLFVTSRPDWDGKGDAALIAIGPKPTK